MLTFRYQGSSLSTRTGDGTEELAHLSGTEGSVLLKSSVEEHVRINIMQHKQTQLHFRARVRERAHTHTHTRTDTNTSTHTHTHTHTHRVCHTVTAQCINAVSVI